MKTIVRFGSGTVRLGFCRSPTAPTEGSFISDLDSTPPSSPTQVTFDWKEEARGSNPRRGMRAIGFVAQEVETILPELVHRCVGVESIGLR